MCYEKKVMIGIYNTTHILIVLTWHIFYVVLALIITKVLFSRKENLYLEVNIFLKDSIYFMLSFNFKFSCKIIYLNKKYKGNIMLVLLYNH